MSTRSHSPSTQTDVTHGLQILLQPMSGGRGDVH